MSKLNVVHIYGRPHGHHIHIAFSKTLDADYVHEDRLLPWYNQNSIKLKRYISWVLNALFFYNRKKYDVFLTECVRPPQLLMKKFGLIKPPKKLIALMADETLYFTYSKKFPLLTRKLMITFWRNCDALICVGNYQAELAKKILPKRFHHNIYTIFAGIPKNQQFELHRNRPDFESSSLIFIGNINAQWRIYYKGLDLIIGAFNLAKEKNKNLELFIVGNIEHHSKAEIINLIKKEFVSSVKFVGEVTKVEPVYNGKALCIHTARGDSFPTSTMEAMCAGIPCLISEETGTKEIVKEVSNELITSINPINIADKINWYFDLKKPEKEQLSFRSREVMKQFTQKKATEKFTRIFNQIIEAQLE